MPVVLGVHQHVVFHDVVLQHTAERKVRDRGKGPTPAAQVAPGRPGLTRFWIRASSSLWASLTASSFPMMVMRSWSLSSAAGNMMRAPVVSRTLRILPPPLPMRNLWYSGLARMSTVKLLVCCGNQPHIRGPDATCSAAEAGEQEAHGDESVG